MDFSLDRGKEVLSRTPDVLRAMLVGVSDDWTTGDEGPGTWTPYSGRGAPHAHR